jgi:hypothetical protein
MVNKANIVLMLITAAMVTSIPNVDTIALTISETNVAVFAMSTLFTMR